MKGENNLSILFEYFMCGFLGAFTCLGLMLGAFAWPVFAAKQRASSDDNKNNLFRMRAGLPDCKKTQGDCSVFGVLCSSRWCVCWSGDSCCRGVYSDNIHMLSLKWMVNGSEIKEEEK